MMGCHGSQNRFDLLLFFNFILFHEFYSILSCFSNFLHLFFQWNWHFLLNLVPVINWRTKKVSWPNTLCANALLRNKNYCKRSKAGFLELLSFDDRVVNAKLCLDCIIFLQKHHFLKRGITFSGSLSHRNVFFIRQVERFTNLSHVLSLISDRNIRAPS